MRESTFIEVKAGPANRVPLPFVAEVIVKMVKASAGPFKFITSA